MIFTEKNRRIQLKPNEDTNKNCRDSRFQKVTPTTVNHHNKFTKTYYSEWILNTINIST